MVWKVVVNNRNLWNPINYLLLNISLGDVVSGISVYPYLFILDVGKVFNHRRKQSALCMVTRGLGIFPIASAVSLITLCGISYNRFLAVRYPFKNNWRINRRPAVIFSILAWVVSTIFNVPNMLSFKYENKLNTCGREWGRINAKAYRLSLLLSWTVIPTAFLLISYIAIIFYARKSKQVALNTKANIDVRLKKAERMVGVLILVYVICWLPVSIYWTMRSVTNYFPKTLAGQANADRWYRITIFFCNLNGTINPIVYAVGNSEINRSIRILFKKSSPSATVIASNKSSSIAPKSLAKQDVTS